MLQVLTAAQDGVAKLFDTHSGACVLPERIRANSFLIQRCGQFVYIYICMICNGLECNGNVMVDNGNGNGNGKWLMYIM